MPKERPGSDDKGRAAEKLPERENSTGEELNELEQLYRTAPVGLCFLDTELRYVRINKLMAEINGTPVSGHIGHTVGDIIPNIAPMLEPLLRQVIETGEPLVDMEIHTATPARPEEERDWLFGYYPAEETLRKSEQQLRLVTDALPVCISYVDSEQRYRFNNKTYEDWFGVGRAELNGRHIKDVLGGSTYAAVRENVEKALSGQVVTFETSLGVAGGGERKVDASFIPHVDQQGETKGFFALVTDVTARKDAEELFRTVAEGTSAVTGADFLRSLVRHLASALKTRYAFVSERDDTGQVSLLEIWTGNGFGESMPLEVSGAPCELVMAGEAAVYPEGVQIRFPGHKTLGELGAESYLGVPLFDSSGRIIGHLAVVDTKAMENSEQGLSVLKVFAARAGAEVERQREEERRRNLEAKLQQALKLESLGVLAGGVAHDFNNLLMGMLGNAEIALQELPPESPARGELKNINTAALRAAELTKQMLAYSGKGKFVVQALNLSKLVEEMAHLLQVSISKNVVLKYNFADNLPAIEADAAQVRQVVMNLILNASEAVGEKRGIVAVSTSVIEADRSYLSKTYLDENLPEGCYVSLEVTDTGCGMDGQTQQKIFDPFFSTKFTGRGLGLAAVLGIVRGHGGALKIDSQPQRGSTFQVLFPASQQPAEETVGTSAMEQKWRGSSVILVVDDEETVRIATKRILETRGFTVLTAEDGRAALQVFRSHVDEIAAVLLDLTMPHLDGEETFRELRGIRPDVRVILSSGYSEQEITKRFVGKGLDGFIQKPYGIRPLVEKIRQVLEAPPESDQA